MSISFPEELIKKGGSCSMEWDETEEYTQKILNSDNPKDLNTILRYMQDKPYLKHNVLAEISCIIMKNNQSKHSSKGSEGSNESDF